MKVWRNVTFDLTKFQKGQINQDVSQPVCPTARFLIFVARPFVPNASGVGVVVPVHSGVQVQIAEPRHPKYKNEVNWLK